MSPNIEPPVVAEEGSIASTAIFFPFCVSCKPRVSIKVDFQTPGVPVRPIFRAFFELFLSLSSTNFE